MTFTNKATPGSFFLVGMLFYMPTGHGFDVDGEIWPRATATYHINFPVAGDRPDWNRAFESAAGEWNDVTPFEFKVARGNAADPCHDPRMPEGPISGAKFSVTVCGEAWGAATLAVTLIWIRGEEIGQSGILFNTIQQWDVFSGPLSENPLIGRREFRRVAVHELGHALGLNHEDDVPAIMSGFTDDIEMPQQDDIDGVEFLYSDFIVEPEPPASSSGGGSLDAVTLALLIIALVMSRRRTGRSR
jgi:hypothetical protein